VCLRTPTPPPPPPPPRFSAVVHKAISCFFSVLRQFKIVKPTRQTGKKTKKLYKKKCFCMFYGRQTLQMFYLIHLSRKEILNKV
jgi:hypothetical protein